MHYFALNCLRNKSLIFIIDLDIENMKIKVNLTVFFSKKKYI